MSIVKMKPSSIRVFILYNYHKMYNIISWKINCTLFKNSNILFELVIDNFFPQNMFKKYTNFWAKTRRKALRLPSTRRTKLSKVKESRKM